MLRDPREAEILADALPLARKIAERTRRLAVQALGEGGHSLGVYRASQVYDLAGSDLIALLAETLFAASLAGAARVGSDLPAGYSAPQSDLSAFALPPEQVERLREAIANVPPEWREEYLAALLPDHARAVAPKEAPTLEEVIAPVLGSEMETHLPLARAAFGQLWRKNLVSYAKVKEMAAKARQEAIAIDTELRQDQMDLVREAAMEAVRDGPNLTVFRERVKDELKPYDAETVFRDAIQGAYSKGMDELLSDPVVGSAFPYRERLPIRDKRLSTMCAILARSGIGGSAIYRADDPVWAATKPSSHPRCRCGTNAITIDMAADKGVREAILWRKTGKPPVMPAYVEWPEGVKRP